MLTDARTLPADARVEADVAIVGAGPAGITLASELQGSGMRVVLIEGGGARPERDAGRFVAGESIGAPYYPLATTRVRGFGGTSNHWLDYGWFRGRPLETVDFEARTEIPHSGWPLSREDLDPFYARANAHCGLGTYDYDVNGYVTDERPELPIVGDVLQTVVFKLSHPRIWRERLDGFAAAEDVDVLLHASVIHIETAGASRVARLRLRTTSGEASVAARTFVLAAGGIANARLLLLSRSDTHPDGLGNGNDLVGRFFMEHPRLRAATIVPADPTLVERTNLYDRHPSGEEGVAIHGKLALRPEVVRDEGIVDIGFFVQGLTSQRGHPAMRSAITLKNALSWRPRPDHLLRHAGNVVPGLGAVATTAVHELRHRLGRDRPPPDELQFEVMAEQAPNPASRVTLGSRRDPFGLPLARLDWQLTPLDLRSVQRATDLVEDALGDGRHGRMRWRLGDVTPVEPWKGGWHHMGTTRMHPDPSEGVVDADARLHGVDNLFVAGSSVFPSSGYANPTLTLVALACRLADRLRAEFA